jgi:hypothetical protein
MSSDSTWTRYPKAKTAVRGADGERVTLMLQRGGWVCLIGTQSHYLESSVDLSLDEVIDVVDQLFLPEGWTCVESGSPARRTWTRPGWIVWSVQDGTWRVGRPVEGSDERSTTTSKVFRSADRARHWAEVRLDRTNANIRGPRPRAEKRALCTLPDVRVTAEEREAAVALAKRLGLTFSDLARAALNFIERETADGGSVTLDRAGSRESFRFLHDA